MRLHVVPHEGDQWAVKPEGRDDPFIIGATFDKVMRDAKRYAREQGDAQLVVHEPDGRTRVYDTVEGRYIEP